jgi:hypothetical protein
MPAYLIFKVAGLLSFLPSIAKRFFLRYIGKWK